MSSTVQQPKSAGTSFGPMKQMKAGLLNVGYVEAGLANGQPVVLLHGWPYDIHSFEQATPVLAASGYHVFVPYLRGMVRQPFFPAKPSETVSNP